jgi:hypothetical protein
MRSVEVLGRQYEARLQPSACLRPDTELVRVERPICSRARRRKVTGLDTCALRQARSGLGPLARPQLHPSSGPAIAMMRSGSSKGVLRP